VPGPVDLLRLAALALFLALVAVGLWLLDATWWAVVLVMAGALLVAWTIEWLAWRGPRAPVIVTEMTDAVAPEPRPAPVPSPAPEAEPQPAPPEAIVPAQLQTEARPAAPLEPEPEPASPPAAVQEEPPGPEPEPEPEPETAPEPPAAALEDAPPPPPERRRQRRMRLRPLPTPRPEPELAPPPVPGPPSSVVAFPQRTFQPRAWNLWDLERIARAETKDHPERRDEFAYLFLHLREFATADGSLPTEFDGLVRESFAGLLERAPRP
jgi:outer membrane biosynthesis protein TonB